MKVGLFCSSHIFVVAVLCVGMAQDFESPQAYNAANCTNVRIPPLLCGSCHLRPQNPDGSYDSGVTKDIFDFDTPECMEQILEYVRLNPCDDKRSQYVAEFKTSSFAYARVAQFMYTVCEQCCDMIPIGSKLFEYESRMEAGTLHTKTRGNGVAHFYFDICKLFPKVTRFIRPQWKTIETLPKLCPMANAWMASNYSRGWTVNANADGIPAPFQTALGIMAKTLGCRNKRVWKDCIPEEQSIGRI